MRNSVDDGSTSFLRQIFVILGWGILLSTLFMSLLPGGLVENTLAGKLQEPIAFEPAPVADFPTPTARPRPRIGIVAGHWGSDSGAVCADELTEAEVNLTIASLVKNQLANEDFDVDLLKEFDPLLNGYRALALVSIHADSCEYINDQATGFKVAAALGTTNPGNPETSFGLFTQSLCRAKWTLLSQRQHYARYDQLSCLR